MNSIIIVGDKLNDISELGWKHNTNYAVVEMVDKLTPAAIETVKNSDMIVQCPTKIFKKYKNDEFLNMLKESNLDVLFVQEKDNYDIEKYDDILKALPEKSFEYIRNKNNDGIDVLENLLTEQVLKGRVNGDNSI